MLTRRAAAAVAGAMLLAPATAAADDGWGEVSCHGSGCDVAAGSGSTTKSAGTAAPGRQPVVNAPEPAPACVPSVPSGLTDPAEQAAWREFACGGQVAFGSVDGPPLAVDPAAVAVVARDRLRLPAPTIGSSPAGAQLVHLPTWLWLREWVPVSASVTVPGVTATATASPSSVDWSLGDGSTVTCAGPGTQYRVGIDPQKSSPDCGHTYTTSSAHEPDSTFPVVATVRWTVSWSAAGQSGSFPDLTTSASIGLKVSEMQALVVGR
ncbi:hypothetical protein [Actinokineospora sp. HUAS TT18]|uniref:hypothetical protein n=1 Tax=Actinokineospora sp. HUAS TT18 TaxID=3447451 RepID=UPI003F5247EA